MPSLREVHLSLFDFRNFKTYYSTLESIISFSTKIFLLNFFAFGSYTIYCRNYYGLGNILIFSVFTNICFICGLYTLFHFLRILIYSENEEAKWRKLTKQYIPLYIDSLITYTLEVSKYNIYCLNK